MKACWISSIAKEHREAKKLSGLFWIDLFCKAVSFEIWRSMIRNTCRWGCSRHCILLVPVDGETYQFITVTGQEQGGLIMHTVWQLTALELHPLQCYPFYPCSKPTLSSRIRQAQIQCLFLLSNGVPSLVCTWGSPGKVHVVSPIFSLELNAP